MPFGRFFITYARRGGARKDMLERVRNATGDILDVYTDPDGIWPALCEAMLCFKVQWPRRDNVVPLPLATDISGDKLGHGAQKRNEIRSLLAPPPVGLEPSLEHPDSGDSAAIATKEVLGEGPEKRSEFESTVSLGTRGPTTAVGAILAQTRLAWGALRVV